MTACPGLPAQGPEHVPPGTAAARGGAALRLLKWQGLALACLLRRAPTRPLTLGSAYTARIVSW